MLLLKGDKGKSEVVDTIMSFTCSKSCTIAYTEPPFYVFWDDVWVVDSSLYGINELIETIDEINKNHNENSFNYLIIYTNETQDDISSLIQWIESNEKDLRCHNVIVTCK